MTNVRYADDILLFGKSLDEAIIMLELLVGVLQGYGLDLNVHKTKLFMTDIVQNVPCYCDTECGMIVQLSEH